MPAHAGRRHALVLLPVTHQPRAQGAIAREQWSVVFLLIGELERLVRADPQGALRDSRPVEPALQFGELRRELSSERLRIFARRVHRRQLRHEARPARFHMVQRQRLPKRRQRLGLAIDQAQDITEGEMDVHHCGTQLDRSPK